MKSVRVFVSSPGDTHFERMRVERVIERLNGEFQGIAKLEAIRWENAYFEEEIAIRMDLAQVVKDDGNVDAKTDLMVALYKLAEVASGDKKDKAIDRGSRFSPLSTPAGSSPTCKRGGRTTSSPCAAAVRNNVVSLLGEAQPPQASLRSGARAPARKARSRRDGARSHPVCARVSLPRRDV